MYIRPPPGYYRGSQQCTMRAPFLILWKDDAEMYGFVRKVALQQFGHFMMGSANVNGKWVTLSGAYGNDGLPRGPQDFPLPKDAKPLPPELYQAWASGGGWNSAGKEAPLLREWAIKEFSVK